MLLVVRYQSQVVRQGTSGNQQIQIIQRGPFGLEVGHVSSCRRIFMKYDYDIDFIVIVNIQTTARLEGAVVCYNCDSMGQRLMKPFQKRVQKPTSGSWV